jgi:hypothetical protein
MDNIKGKVSQVNSKNDKKSVFVKKTAKFFLEFRLANLLKP